MSVGPDETEQLLEQLQAELDEKQARVDERVAREQARLDELSGRLEAFEERRKQAEATLETLTPRYQALVKERDETLQRGSKGNRLRAHLWVALSCALTAGLVVPLADQKLAPWVLAVLLGEGVALAIGWGLTELWQRRLD